MYLLSHWLWICDRCAKKAAPLKSPVQTGPVVVTIAGMGQTPRNQRVELAVSRVTLLPFSTGANSTEFSSAGAAIFLVIVGIAPGNKSQVTGIFTYCKDFAFITSISIFIYTRNLSAKKDYLQYLFNNNMKKMNKIMRIAALPRGRVWVLWKVRKILSKTCFKTSDEFFFLNVVRDINPVLTPEKQKPRFAYSYLTLGICRSPRLLVLYS